MTNFIKTKENQVITFENGLKVKFIGQVDTENNQDLLFKTIYSPFATPKWIKMRIDQFNKKTIIQNKYPVIIPLIFAITIITIIALTTQLLNLNQ